MDIKTLEDLKQSMEKNRKNVKCTSHKVTLSKENLILFWKAQIEECDNRIDYLLNHLANSNIISKGELALYREIKEERKFCEKKLKEIE